VLCIETIDGILENKQAKIYPPEENPNLE